MNRIQSKNHRKGTYEINKFSLSHFDEKFIFLIMAFEGCILDLNATSVFCKYPILDLR